MLEAFYNVEAYFVAYGSPADGEHKHGVSTAQSASLQPVCVAGLPSIIVDACGKFRDIICRRISFNASDFATVVHRVAGVPRSATYAEKKHPAILRPDFAKQIDGFFNRGGIEKRRNLANTIQIPERKFASLQSPLHSHCGFGVASKRRHGSGIPPRLPDHGIKVLAKYLWSAQKERHHCA